MQVVDADSGQQVIPCKEFVEAANAIIAIFDSNGDGTIDYTELFQSAVPSLSLQRVEKGSLNYIPVCLGELPISLGCGGWGVRPWCWGL